MLAFGLLPAGGPVHGQGAFPAAVGSQAHTDAAAQQRLQETTRQAQRQRRIEDQIRHVISALSEENLASSAGPGLTRQGLAALMILRQEGISAEEAFQRATRSAGINPSAAARPIAYLRKLLSQNAEKITPPLLALLEAGEDPGPTLILPPYQP